MKKRCTHIYIQCTRGGWNEIIMYRKNWIKKKERKHSVCKWQSFNSRYESNYGGNSPWQRNSRKTNKRREDLSLLYSHQQSWNLKQAITLKHLITYINPKGMIGMPIINHHVWGHAYGHDNSFFFLHLFW